MRIGVEYKVGESKPWDWFGTPRWWEIFAVKDGWNGVGGYWIKERWRWNRSQENIRSDIKTLSHAETKELRGNAAKWLKSERRKTKEGR